MKNITYKELANIIMSNSDIHNKEVAIYQTDNFVRECSGMQIGMGGTFIKAVRGN